MVMKRGIYLVANFKSQELCENLVFSIRSGGCNLPIRLIHFGGKVVSSPYILRHVEILYYENFSKEAKSFITNIRTVLTDCPLAYLYRYLAWFSDWDEFIYSDNDVVALINWENLFAYLKDNDLVHADEEYTTKGRFNYQKPELVEAIFGEGALDSAITAGHMVVRRNPQMLEDIACAVNWFKENPDIPKKHDQTLLHIASLVGKWKVLNLCKPPNNWLSSWAGDYKNSLQVIQNIQTKNTKISHLHYSGGNPQGDLPIHDLLFSVFSVKKRLSFLLFTCLRLLSGYNFIEKKYSGLRRLLKR